MSSENMLIQKWSDYVDQNAKQIASLLNAGSIEEASILATNLVARRKEELETSKNPPPVVTTYVDKASGLKKTINNAQPIIDVCRARIKIIDEKMPAIKDLFRNAGAEFNIG